MKKKAPLEIDRNIFEREVKKRGITLDEFLEKVKSGQIKGNELIFTLDPLLEICDRVAIGIYYNTKKLENPKGKWAGDTIRRQINKFIKYAFPK